MLMPINHKFTIKVAQAHPTTPSAGKSQKPKVKAIESGIFRPKATICRPVTHIGFPKLWFKVAYILNSKEGPTAIAKICKYARISA